MSTAGTPHGVGALAGSTILVVDDEPVARAAIEDILTMFGATVRCAGSVSEGTAAAATAGGHVDAVVLDLGLCGDGDAGVLAPWSAACPDAAILVVSGADRARAEERLAADHDWALLLKPFSASDLVAALRRALDGRGSDRPHHSS